MPNAELAMPSAGCRMPDAECRSTAMDRNAASAFLIQYSAFGIGQSAFRVHLVLNALVEKLVRHEDLTEDEAASAMCEVMEGRAVPSSLGALLALLAMKGERPAELVGFARTMRERAVKLSRPVDRVFDTCGTGGDRSGTFNVSSAAAVVVAACGVPVAKHGNRSVSSRCGSADVFERLGVEIGALPEVVERSLRDGGIAFFFAPTFHPAMKHAAETRRALGIRTAFNLLGPLTNPAGASRQIVGVPRPELTELLARSLLRLGAEWAWVVHGADGVDEISTAGHTKVSECRGGAVRTFYLHPSDVGLPKASLQDLRGGDAAENAAIVTRVLAGERGAPRDVVLFNAGAALFVAGRAPSIVEGIRTAAEGIDSGAAQSKLDWMVRASRAETVA
jgi:anthranilate phosphoribosyltransferase